MDLVYGMRQRNSQWKYHSHGATFVALMPIIDLPPPTMKILSQSADETVYKLPEKSRCYTKEWDVFTLDTCLHEDGEKLVFIAKVPDNAWLSIGFGRSMTNTDMIAWRVVEGQGFTEDYWSTSHATPVLDDTQDLTDVSELTSFEDGVMTFVTERALDTGDES